MPTIFSLLERSSKKRQASADLVLPIRFSANARHMFSSCKNPILVMIEGQTGSGKSQRFNQLTSADFMSETPFDSSAGGAGVTTDFLTFGPILLSHFCSQWRIPHTAGDEFNLFFCDSEGKGNVNGVDENLGKALAVVSSVTTIRISVSQNRLCDDVMAGLDGALKFQCLRTKTASVTELSSAIVFMYRDVGFAGPPATSLLEMEQRRHDQDAASFATVFEKLPKCGLTKDNLLVLLQPQYAGRRPIPFGEDSYMESLRDLARFIDCVCRTKRSPGFPWMDSVLTTIARLIHDSPTVPNGPVNINDRIVLICTGFAEHTCQSILAGKDFAAKTEMERTSIRTFPYEGPSAQRLADETVGVFERECASFYPGLKAEIPDKVALLERQIREMINEAVKIQWNARHAMFLKQMNDKIATVGEQLAREASQAAVNAVTALTFEQALGYASDGQFCDSAVRNATGKLRIAIEQLHPNGPNLVPHAFDVMVAKFDRDVRTAVRPVWLSKQQGAQRWKASELNKAHQRELEAKDRENQHRIRLAQEEHNRNIAARERQKKQDEEAREWERKEKWPQNLTEMIEVRQRKGITDDLVGKIVKLYPNRGSELKYRVLSYSPFDSRLELVVPTGLNIWMVSVTWDGDTAINEISCQNIPFYINGDTMGIVFTQSISLDTVKCIEINFPAGTDISNLTYCGYYERWRDNKRPHQVILRRSGTYNRGPRIEGDSC
jgi:hypothetical protein